MKFYNCLKQKFWEKFICVQRLVFWNNIVNTTTFSAYISTFKSTQYVIAKCFNFFDVELCIFIFEVHNLYTFTVDIIF